MLVSIRMSEDEDDLEEKVGPTIRYLQKLGSEHLDLIFETSRWVFETDRKAGLEVRNALSLPTLIDLIKLFGLDFHR